MREEQSETTEAAETGEGEETTSCKRQGHPRFRHTSSHLVRALKFTKSLSRRNKKQHGGASAVDEIEVTLNEENSDSDSAAAAEAVEKKGEKKSVTFAEEISEEIRVQDFEVHDDERTKKTRNKSRRHRHNSRRAHDDDEPDVSMYEERDDDQPFTILPCCKMSTAAAADDDDDDDSVLLTPTGQRYRLMWRSRRRDRS